jgi:FdhE protein
MRDAWARRIRRASELATADNPSAPLLDFYARLLGAQQGIYDALGDGRLSGSLERDAARLVGPAASLLRVVADHGPEPLAAEADALCRGTASNVADRLIAYWLSPSDREFFAKATLQPYAQRLAESRIAPAGRFESHADNRCPFCGGRPQLSILESTGESGIDGGGRSLLCGTCLGPWAFRRLLCPSCGEDQEKQLGYFRSSSFDHLRLDTCDSCRRYLKSVDLGRLGLAVPIVDEVAGAPLDLWARERGYEKIELNLLGL